MNQNTPARCLCGRLLADPASRARGLGPVYFRRLRGHTAPSPRAAPEPEIPGQLAIPV
jgi:hypothetical protein